MSEAPRKNSTLLWLAIAALVWLGAWGVQRARDTRQPERPAWQRPVNELTDAQREHESALRRALVEAESARSATRTWPGTLAPGVSKSENGLYVNYLGDADGLRWLVLIVEPDPRQPPDTARVDDEHHALADGTLIHVTIWTQPIEGDAPRELIAFPAAEGWVERIRAE